MYYRDRDERKKKNDEEKRMRGREYNVGMFKLQIIVSRFLKT